MKPIRLFGNLPVHFLLGWILVAVTLFFVCFMIPSREETLSESYLIFFFHFPSAICCLLLFLIAGVISIMQLKKNCMRADLLAASCVEVGLLACSICLVTGMVWAQAAWGKPWVWHDKRLLSVAIMWLCYLAYLVFRANIDNHEQRARFSSVLGILFSLNVPLVILSIRIFGGKVSHPMKVTLDGDYMKLTQWFGALSFFVLYWAFWRLRYRGLLCRNEADRLDEKFMYEKM